VFAFGHRFSLVWLGDACPTPAIYDAIAADAALHDGRGCFSPVAVFTPTDGRDVAAALSDALDRAHVRWPVGVVHPIEGAQIRARGALARVEGVSHATAGGSVHLLPAARFEPIALPRAIAVHPVRDLAHALDVVRPWSRWLSSVAAEPHVAEPWLDLGATRVCAPGSLQRPALNRAHDGVDWVRATARQTSG